MPTMRLATWTAATILLFAAGGRAAGAATIAIPATVSDRGLDTFPWDGVGANVFGNPSVVQITTPPLGSQFSSEERTAVEFPLGTIPMGSTIDSVLIRLSPVGQTANIGLGVGEVTVLHGYAGDGLIQLADLMDSVQLASIAGPTPNGPLTVPLPVGWLQDLVDSASLYAGLMFRGVPGPAAVVYTFDAAFGAVPVAERPTLTVEYHEGAVVPEPGSLVLTVTGLAALHRSRRLVAVVKARPQERAS